MGKKVSNPCPPENIRKPTPPPSPPRRAASCSNYDRGLPMSMKAFQWQKMGDHKGVQQEYISTHGGDTDLTDEFFIETAKGVKRVVAGDFIVEKDGKVIDVAPPQRFNMGYRSQCGLVRDVRGELSPESLRGIWKIWEPVDEYVRKHPAMKLGFSVSEMALELLKSRDELKRNFTALQTAMGAARTPEPFRLLTELVKALDETNWSSWQTTAKFDSELDAARQFISEVTL